jgi:hypothetical protein
LYLHVGGDRLVALASIIAILDAAVLDRSPETRQMYLRLRSEGAVVGVDPDWRRSLVLTDDGIVESSVSSVTLMDRWARWAANMETIEAQAEQHDTI